MAGRPPPLPLPLLFQLPWGRRGLPAAPPPCPGPGPSASRPSPCPPQPPPPSSERAKPPPAAAPSDSAAAGAAGSAGRRRIPVVLHQKALALHRAEEQGRAEGELAVTTFSLAPCTPLPAAINQSDTAILRSFTGNLPPGRRGGAFRPGPAAIFPLPPQRPYGGCAEVTSASR